MPNNRIRQNKEYTNRNMFMKDYWPQKQNQMMSFGILVNSNKDVKLKKHGKIERNHYLVRMETTTNTKNASCERRKRKPKQ